MIDSGYSPDVLLLAARRAGVMADALAVQRELYARLCAGEHVAVMAPRRSGKTEGTIRALIARSSALRRPYRVAWIEDFASTAWETVQPICDDIAQRYGLEVQFNAVTNRVKIGSYLTITCCGARQERFVAQLRGKKWDCVVIDEAQRMWDVDLAAHVSRIIMPALADRRG